VHDLLWQLQQFSLNRLCCFPGDIVAVDLSHLTLAFAAMFEHCPSNLSLVLTATVEYIFILSLSSHRWTNPCLAGIHKNTDEGSREDLIS